MTAETREPDAPLPRDLAGYRDRHRGETLVVCGCGRSLNSLEDPRRFVTVGVNDVGRRFDPTYLVILNPRSQFKDDRFRYVEASRSRALFTQLDLGVPHPHVVRFKLGRRGGTDLSDPSSLPYTNNSPYVALCLAAHMGATRIGVIGVDFTDHHFFANTGRHSLAGTFARIDQEYGQLARAWAAAGIEIFNLSAQSRLSAFPKVTPAELAAMAPRPSREPFVSALGPPQPPARPAPRHPPPTPTPLDAPYEGWLDHGEVSTLKASGNLVLDQPHRREPGGERGLVSAEAYGDVELAFELRLHPGAHFLAKLQQADAVDQTRDSYHLACRPRQTYVARQNLVLAPAEIPRGRWVAITFQRAGDLIRLRVDGEIVVEVRDTLLEKGHCYLGTKGGKVELRRVELRKVSVAVPEADSEPAARPAGEPATDSSESEKEAPPDRERRQPPALQPLPAPFSDWLDDHGTAQLDGGGLMVLERAAAGRGGSEQGLASVRRYAGVELGFELRLAVDAHFVAKVQQQDQLDQSSNSYHLACLPGRSYVARHDKILAEVEVPRRRWVAVTLRRSGELLELWLDGRLATRADDGALDGGYCFLGTRGGRVELRGIELTAPEAAAEPAARVEGTARGDTEAASSDDAEPPRQPPPASVAGNGRVGALIPTRGDRPRLLEHCLAQLRSQTRPPDEIILVDDPPRSHHKDITWRYRLGVERARAKGVDAIMICEDDDWYHPEYLEWLLEGWQRHGRPPIFGVAETWYYHLAIGKRKHLSHPGRASGFCTLISGALESIRWPADHHPFVDLHLWRHIPGKAVPFGDKIRAIGIKHGIGMTGGIAHRRNFGWERVDGRPWFSRTVDPRSRQFYSEIV